ncbi:MAG TPA: ECF-type sigma factor [Phycisphaerales bacterium]|nr:ECF-type sigma factor [Phycisphaerales bacterium]
MARMGEGDRVALGEFLGRYGPLIRRRVRGKLRASVRRLYDSQDILSTVSRRLDAYVKSGKFQARTEDEFWGLVFRVAQRSLVEKARIVEALRAKEGEDSEFAGWMLGRLRGQEPDERARTDGLEVDDLLDALKSDEDRTITRLWAGGANHSQIASHLGIDDAAVRQRWCRICQMLQESLTERAA